MVRVATHKENIKYIELRFSLNPSAGSGAAEYEIDACSENPRLNAVIHFDLWFGATLFVVYLAYSLLRVGRWLCGFLPSLIPVLKARVEPAIVQGKPKRWL